MCWPGLEPGAFRLWAQSFATEPRASGLKKFYGRYICQILSFQKRSLKEELKKPEELESDDENEMKSDPKNLKPIVDDGTPRDFRVQDISMDSLRVDKLIRKLFTVTGK